MTKYNWVRCFAVASGLYCTMWVTADRGGAAEPAASFQPATPQSVPAQVLSRDITLGPNGRMEGILLDRQGAAHGGLPVMLLRDGQEVASTTTDVAGKFAIEGLRGGKYTLATVDSVTPCRLWSEGTAPPSSQPALHIYGGDLVRGQMFRVRNFITNPVVIGAAIGTAVAVPLALHNREPSS